MEMKYTDIKETVILTAYENMICEERYQYTNIAEFWNNEMVEFVSQKEWENRYDRFEENRKNYYRHIEEILSKISSDANTRYRVRAEKST